MAQSARKLKIVIIGGGIAGVAAAEALTGAGFENLVLLEASDRIGGRISTFYDSGKDGLPYKLELGANWIHGSLGNPIYAAAEENNLFAELASCKHQTSRCSSHCLTESGKTVSAGALSKISLRLKTVQGKSTYVPEEATSMNDLLNAEFSKYLEGFGEEDRCLQRAIIEHLILLENAVDGCDHMNELSAKYFNAYLELKGPDTVIKQGYDKVVQCMVQRIPPEVIQVQCPVQCVDWSACSIPTNDARLVTRRPVKLHVDNHVKKTLDADCVIVTCPLGYLKESASKIFKPRLPEPKMLAIERLGIHAVNKVFLEFKNLDFMPVGTNYLQLFWDMTKPTYQDKDRNGSDWTRRLFEFSVEDTPEEKTLITWLVGKEAIYVETLTDKQVAKGCVQVLRRFLKNKDIPMPKKILRTNWYSKPYIKGSYSYTPVGALPTDRETLSEPICHPQTAKPVVMFAGEATHPSFYSTVHGALLSGQREAQRIINAYGNQPTASL